MRTRPSADARRRKARACAGRQSPRAGRGHRGRAGARRAGHRTGSRPATHGPGSFFTEKEEGKLALRRGFKIASRRNSRGRGRRDQGRPRAGDH